MAQSRLAWSSPAAIDDFLPFLTPHPGTKSPGVWLFAFRPRLDRAPLDESDIGNDFRLEDPQEVAKLAEHLGIVSQTTGKS
jgi:hypothetical protein